jgi:hypothetical protein
MQWCTVFRRALNIHLSSVKQESDRRRSAPALDGMLKQGELDVIRVLSAGPNKKNIGHPTVLNVAQEEELCNRIFRLAAIGMPINNCVLRRSVFFLL